MIIIKRKWGLILFTYITINGKLADLFSLLLIARHVHILGGSGTAGSGCSGATALSGLGVEVEEGR